MDGAAAALIDTGSLFPVSLGNDGEGRVARIVNRKKGMAVALNHKGRNRHGVLASACVAGQTLGQALALAVGLAGAVPTHALAEDAVAAARSFDIPAGPLSTALGRFAVEAGVLLSVDAELTRGKTSAGLRGAYAVDEGFRQLLRGSGLEAVRTGDGYALRVMPLGEGATLLQAVKVEANAERSSTTENSGAYKSAQTRSATGLDLSPRETPQSITVMTHDRMRDQGLTAISSVLEQVVGVEAASTSALGSDGTSYYARGFAVQNYQVDGIPRPAGVYGFAEETADMMAYDRIEILRGASGLMTGQGEPSATINLIRKRPTAQKQASVSAMAGSWDRYRLEADASGPLTASGAVRGRLAGAYEQTDSFVEREHAGRKVAYGAIDIDLGAATLLSGGVEYQNFSNDNASRGGLPLFFTDGTKTDFSRSTNTGANWSQFEKDSLNVFASVLHRLGDNWRLRLDAERKDGSYDEAFGYLYSSALDKTTGAGGTLYAARWARDLELNGASASLLGGFDWLGRRQELSLTLLHANYEDKGPDYPGWWAGSAYAAPVANAFAFYDTGDIARPMLDAAGSSAGHKVKQTALSGVMRLKPLEPLAVILGSRVTKFETSDWSRSASGEKTVTPGADESAVWTPYAGVVFDLSRTLSAYASYTSIFQPQTIKDINGRVLDPVEGNNYELGLKAEFFDGLLDASAAVFRMKQKNYGLALGDGINAPDGSPAYRPSEGARSKGFELDISGELLPGWKLAGGVAHAKAEDHDGSSLNANVPENTFKLFTTYQLRDALKDLLVGGNVRWQDTTRAVDVGANWDQTYKQDSLALLDLLARYALSPQASLSLNINNVLDKSYYGGLAGGSSRYGEPRSFRLWLRYELF